LHALSLGFWTNARLDLPRNVRVLRFPNSCLLTTRGLDRLPSNLASLDLSYSTFNCIDTPLSFPQLTYLSLAHTLSVRSKVLFCFCSNASSLETLDLSYSKQRTEVEGEDAPLLTAGDLDDLPLALQTLCLSKSDASSLGHLLPAGVVKILQTAVQSDGAFI